MLFSIGTALKNLRRNVSVYLPVLFLTMICIGAICFLLSGIVSFVANYQSILLQPEARDYQVTSMSLNSNSTTLERDRRTPYTTRGLPVTQEDLYYLENECGDLRIKLKEEHLLFIYAEETGMMEAVIYYLSDAFYEDMGIEPCVIVADPLMDIFKGYSPEEWDDYLTMLKCDYDPDSNTFVSFQGNVFPALLTSQADISRLDTIGFEETMAEWQYDMVGMVANLGVLVPVQAMFDCPIGDFCELRIIVDGELSDLTRALKYLSARHDSEYSYFLSSTAFQLLDEVRQQQQTLMALLPGTMLLLIVVGISFLGIQIIQFERNKRSLAVAMTMGATASKLTMETMIKAVVPPLLGGALGCLLTGILMLRLKLGLLQAALMPSVLSIAASLLLCLLLGILSCLPTIRKIKALSPMTVLKDSVV